MQILVSWAGSAGEFELRLCLPEGALLSDALSAAELQLRCAGAAAAKSVDWSGAETGIYGELRPRGTILRDGDRVEIYRPLPTDPKESRRARAQRVRSACATPLRVERGAQR